MSVYCISVDRKVFLVGLRSDIQDLISDPDAGGSSKSDTTLAVNKLVRGLVPERRSLC